MTKAEHIAYWRDEAKRNLETGHYLMDGRQSVMALFLYNLAIEKTLKAHWVKDNIDNHPPRTHELQHLHNQTDLSLSSDDYDYLAVVNQWSIDTRYPDYRQKIYAIANESYMKKHREKITALFQCLQEKL